VDEVLGRIEHVFRRSDAAQNLRGGSQEIEGSLGQLGSADLLQVLAMNRRTGKLALFRGDERGELWLGEGRPTAARSGRTEGEKSLFRLLAWTEGTFRFSPDVTPPQGLTAISRSMDDALLEGMRQTDERARLLPSLPPAPAHDLDVLSAIATLLNKGVARVLEEEPEEIAPALGPAETHALRTLALRRRGSNPRLAVAKVLVCGGVRAARSFLEEVLAAGEPNLELFPVDRKSTRLNSSHVKI